MARTERGAEGATDGVDDPVGEPAGTPASDHDGDHGGDGDHGDHGDDGGAGVVDGSASNPSPEDAPALSVVVVTRNEADRVADCLESVFAACRPVDSFEVILVDSNSTDGTVERATDYPVTVLRIPSDELSTPGAGRHVGTRHASADRILFVDGDMVVEPDWLPPALDAVADPDVAAVDGWLNDRSDDAVREVDSVRGVALYDADALAVVGGFDPFLRSLEDVHLGFELTAAGYRLLRLPRVAASHPRRPPVTEPVRRVRRRYADGIGQVLRKSATRPTLLARHLSRERYRLTVWAWLAVGLVSLRHRTARRSWAVLSLLGFLYVARQLGPVDALSFAVDKVVVTLGIALGARAPIRETDTFPLADVEVVTEGPVHGDGPAPVGDGPVPVGDGPVPVGDGSVSVGDGRAPVDDAGSPAGDPSSATTDDE